MGVSRTLRLPFVPADNTGHWCKHDKACALCLHTTPVPHTQRDALRRMWHALLFRTDQTSAPLVAVVMLTRNAACLSAAGTHVKCGRRLSRPRTGDGMNSSMRLVAAPLAPPAPDMPRAAVPDPPGATVEAGDAVAVVAVVVALLVWLAKLLRCQARGLAQLATTATAFGTPLHGHAGTASGLRGTAVTNDCQRQAASSPNVFASPHSWSWRSCVYSDRGR